MLDKTFRPDEVEPRLYDAWERAGAFKAGARTGAKPYAIVIPPPNITGSLHLGHALNNTLQDILVRFERMRGRDVLWQPGTDHAGIATQMVVERDLALEQSSREKIGREAFVKRVWEWKEKSGGTITRQLKRLGCSCDWSRERFTMDEGLSRAVTRVFVQLYREGLIYKDKRLVNWDPKLQTAISDLEVIPREVKGHLWHIKYPLADDSGRFIVVATTRPETMLGDTAVAVHPDDERYKALVGKEVILPLVGRKVPIIADEYADPEQGSGAVKITPAHDFNDFEVGRRHKLPLINIFDERARLNDTVPAPYRGLDRFEARKRVVADLEAQDLMEKIEANVHTVPHGDRSDAVIEPWLTDQWYADAKTLAKPAIEAVERGETVFVPRNWEKTYFEWLRNIEPWCISRQLWWGHQIPAWYGPAMLPHPGVDTTEKFVGSFMFVAETEAEAIRQAEEAYNSSALGNLGIRVGIASSEAEMQQAIHEKAPDGSRLLKLYRDPDVLDTWFSSQLWPFSTLGWPEETPALKRYYPTDVLVTGFDIIFFWVARMMMAGLHFMEEVPFKTVYIHALVRDEKGAKMSKSKGNVMDPLDLIDDYGADALRFTLAAMAAQGRDIKLSRARIEGYRNFTTKLWNAARFCQMNECKPVETFDPSTLRETVNRWILGALVQAEREVTEALEAFKFNEAASALYHFVWHVYCDWYVEFVKPLFADEKSRTETQATAAFVLDHILLLLHPFMPFVTEELWARAAEGAPSRKSMLVLADWPRLSTLAVDRDAMAEMDWVVRLISGVRSVRAEINVPAGAEISLSIVGAAADTRARMARHKPLIVRLARLSALDLANAVAKGAVQVLLDEATLALPLAGIVDLAKEQNRLTRELEKLVGEIGKLEQKLQDASFVSRAPEDVVEENRERLADFTAAREKLSQALARLPGAA